VEELLGRVGAHLGYTGWTRLTRERVAAFADATDDHQWIHLDERRAAATRFGGPIVHGYLLLSLVSPLLERLLPRRAGGIRVNYGCDRVRFLTPVPVGAHVRLGATVRSVQPVRGGVQAALTVVVSVRGRQAPAVVARVILRGYDDAPPLINASG
jgi:acyl dehydratase